MTLQLRSGAARAWVAALLATLIAGLVAWEVLALLEERARAADRARTLDALEDARGRLHRELQVALAVPETVASFLATQGRIDKTDIAAALSRAVNANRHLRTLQYAEAGPADAMLRETVIAPLNRLAGGGLGLSSRTPVVRGANERAVVAATISADALFDDVGFRRQVRDERFELALRPLAPGSALAAGPERVFAAQPVTLEYALPGGERLQLAAIPAGGWNAAARVPLWAQALAYLAALAVGIVAFFAVRSRQRLADRMQFISDLFEAVPAGLALRDLDGRWVYVNRTWEKMFNSDRNRVIGQHVRDRVPEKEAELLLSLDQEALKKGEAVRQEMIYRGRHISQVRSVPTDAQGAPVGVLIASIDTTDRYILEQTLGAQAKQLEQKNEALEESVRLREEVERIGRHDLKTPLNSILAVPRLLRENRNLTREDLDLVNIVERAGYRLLNMVNLSLDLFKMEQGTYRFDPRPVDLMDVVGKVMVDVMSHAESKNVLIRTLVNGRASSVLMPVYAWADELLCYSMLGNLAKNAIEASPEGSTVTISIEGRDVAMVRIHNAGAVPAAIRESFFDKYASAGKSEGTGLGTYSARLMARTQGGDVSMRTSEEAGTTLTVWLRAAPASALPAQTPAAVEVSRPGALASIGDMRVLVVDDDEFNRLLVRRYLPPPAVVDSAVNGRAAIEAARAAPEAILMDLDMPIMDGYEAVDVIRRDERERGRKRAAIIALSSHDDDEVRARCLASGFDFYLTKPVTRELLHQTLARFREGVAAGASVSPPPAVLAANAELDDEMKALIPGFLASRREIAHDMSRALTDGDREGLRRAAHKLAGSFALYGFDWAAEHCRTLERDAPAGEPERLGAMIAELHHHLDEVTAP